MSNIPAIYRALDIKNRSLIQRTCPVVDLDGFTWYDTTQYGFHGEKLYLLSRGVIVLHPVNSALIRFPDAKPEPKQMSFDFKRLLKARP